MASHAELSSLASSLEELTGRVTALADSTASAQREELAAELYGVERSLQAALRRLRRVAGTGR